MSTNGGFGNRGGARAARHGMGLWRAYGAGGGVAALALVMAAGFALSPGAKRTALAVWDSVCYGDSAPMFASSAADKATGRAATIVTPLSCSPLASVPGKSVTTAMVEFPPGAFSGPHRHPGEVTAVVLEGLVRSQLDSGASITYAAGQTWFEPPRTLHNFAENPDPAKPARLLAFFVADNNCGPLTIPEK
ncbi:MAG TPA: cupin domain-containing protein [Burkholderiales bacterium]